VRCGMEAFARDADSNARTRTTHNKAATCFVLMMS
jgi:hypothetical protein